MAQTESMTISTMYRGTESRVCHNDKERESAVKEGFVPYNPADHAYPCWFYKGAESKLAATAAEAAKLTKAGWANKPTEEYARSLNTVDAAPAVALQGAIDVSVLTALSEHDDHIDALRDEVELLKSRLTALETK